MDRARARHGVSLSRAIRDIHIHLLLCAGGVVRCHNSTLVLISLGPGHFSWHQVTMPNDTILWGVSLPLQILKGEALDGDAISRRVDASKTCIENKHRGVWVIIRKWVPQSRSSTSQVLKHHIFQAICRDTVPIPTGAKDPWIHRHVIAERDVLRGESSPPHCIRVITSVLDECVLDPGIAYIPMQVKSISLGGL